jgi:hypothetical protein
MKASRLPKVLVSFLLLACFALGAGTALAAVPQTFNYQGFLTNKTTGVPLSATVGVTFKLSNSLTAGTLLYSETQPTVTNGVFSTQFATPVAAGNPAFSTQSFDEPYWLDITVGADILAPRPPLAFSATALHAATADTATAAVSVTGSISGLQITGTISNATIGGAQVTGTISHATIAGSQVASRASLLPIDIRNVRF